MGNEAITAVNSKPTKDYDFADAAKKQYEAAALKKASGNGGVPHDTVWKNPLEALLPAQNPATIFSDKGTYKAPIMGAQASATPPHSNNYQPRNSQEANPNKNIGGEYKLAASMDGVGGNQGGQSSGNPNHQDGNPKKDQYVLNHADLDLLREKKLNEVT